MSMQLNNNQVFEGVSSLIYRYNEETCSYDRIRAELLYMQKGSDAKLEILSDDNQVPDWITEDTYVSMNVVWPSKGLVVFSGVVTYVLGSRIHVGDIQFMETIQRRRDVKVQYNSEGRLISKDGSYRFHIIFENISAGGVGFKMLTDEYSRREVVPGAEFTLEFNPENDEKVVRIPLKIVRCTGSDEHGLLHAGASFENLRPGTESLLRQLVFQQQKEENAKEKELKKSGRIEIDVFLKKNALKGKNK
ncbi:MAG: PilZ domain-containing protein [Anaerovoracaceae bacterium]